MTEENTEKNLLSREEKEEVVRIFENINFAYPLNEIIEELKNNEYSDAGKIILNAIFDNILDISDIENDSTVYIALGMEGEDIWKELNGNEEEENEEK